MADPVQADVLRVATWNVHGFVGGDGVADARRVAAVIRALNADAVGLQEVSAAPFGDPESCSGALARWTGMNVVDGFARGSGCEAFGNLLLVRGTPAEDTRLDLGKLGREQRGAVAARLPCGTLAVTTHLGLERAERRRQMRRIGRWLEGFADGPGVILGDFNEWIPWNLSSSFGFPLTLPTMGPSFPARLPLFALDRVGWWGGQRAAFGGAVRSAEARAASDHLPVLAGFTMPPG